MVAGGTPITRNGSRLLANARPFPSLHTATQISVSRKEWCQFFWGVLEGCPGGFGSTLSFLRKVLPLLFGQSGLQTTTTFSPKAFGPLPVAGLACVDAVAWRMIWKNSCPDSSGSQTQRQNYKKNGLSFASLDLFLKSWHAAIAMISGSTVTGNQTWLPLYTLRLTVLRPFSLETYTQAQNILKLKSKVGTSVPKMFPEVFSLGGGVSSLLCRPWSLGGWPPPPPQKRTKLNLRDPTHTHKHTNTRTGIPYPDTNTLNVTDLQNWKTRDVEITTVRRTAHLIFVYRKKPKN